MIIARTGLAARYRLQAHRVDSRGRIVRTRLVADWFSNLITDAGLNSMGVRSGNIAQCQVGSGNTPPETTDTGLNAFVAANNSTHSNSWGYRGTPPYYIRGTRTYRFDVGVAAGNLSEVGVGWTSSGGGLWSRTLIKDTLGNPTTVTVLPDEILDVTFTIRTYPPTEDVEGVIDIGGIEHSYLLRASNIFQGSGTGGWSYYDGELMALAGPTRQTAYNGPIGELHQAPSGQFSNAGASSNYAYANNSLAREGLITWGLNEGSVTGGIQSIRVDFNHATYQVQFEPKIQKTSSKVLTLRVRQSWGRHIE